MSKKLEYLNIPQIFFYLIITYLISQFHEMGHWLACIFFGQKFVVLPSEVIRTNFEEASQSANVIISGMGVVFNLVISIIGILLLTKSKDKFWTRTGYFTSYISSIGMVGYHIAGLFSLTHTDSEGVANHLSISRPVVIVPMMVIFVLLSVITIRNTPKEYKGLFYPSIFFLMILFERFLVVFLYNTYMYSQYNSGGFVIEPVLSFPVSLLSINLVSIGLFVLFIANRKKYFQFESASM